MMDTSSFFLTLVGGTGIGYLFGRTQTWRLAKKLEKHHIKPSEWEEPLIEAAEDVVNTLGRNITA